MLNDQNAETLLHVVMEGITEYISRAFTSDFAYLQAWSLAAGGLPGSRPASFFTQAI
ncbi:hypothetical protein [Pseudorhizobium flavum]|jgi:hypothetical protein|uniref:Uncharacterized protein n=1 Tax=Pseudorhizobium flavum TaxID=1335061 RepID=A0A7X0DEN7_9HYPH|nr:hypothetical protein [Pseudorhizobium flavum]MBB6182000.1 hypothetical protein [Pseudorhizobium flavum]CAD6631509.1 integrase [Pseudorhizobium flavum]